MKNLSNLFMAVMVAATLSVTGCDGDSGGGDGVEDSYMDVTAVEAKVLIDDNPELIIIDVSPLWEAGHLPGAVNYPVGDGSLDDAIPMLDSMAKYLVYCHGDEPSMLGAQTLVDAGFDKVYRLEGNYSAWVDAGYDVVTEDM